MTIKEQLIQEIQQVPEDTAAQLLKFLHLLQFQQRNSGSPPPPLKRGESEERNSISTIETDDSPFVDIDGFLVVKTQEPLPEIDWVSLVREERINDLMDYESLV